MRLHDLTLAPLTHVVLQYLLRVGAVCYRGGFCARRDALEAIGGFDTSIGFHGEDTNLGRRLAAVGLVAFSNRCCIQTSAGRYRALGKRAVFALDVRNFCSEIIWHRPSDTAHVDVRMERRGTRQPGRHEGATKTGSRLPGA